VRSLVEYVRWEASQMPARHRNPVSEPSELDPTLDDLRGAQPDQLRAILGWLDTELSELAADEDPEAQGRFTRLLAVRDDAQARLAAHQVAAEALTHPRAMSRWGGNPAGSQAFTRDAAEALRLAGDDLRSAALRSLEQVGRDLAPGQQDRVDELVRAKLSRDQPNTDGEYISRRLLITESPEYRSAFRRVMAEDHPILTEAEIRALRAYQELESRSLGEWAAPGSYGVPVTLDPTILPSSGAAAAPVLAAARTVTITGNHWKGITSAPPVFTFQTEGSAAADASPSMAQPEIYVHTARSFIPYSLEVETDWPGFASEMGALLAQGWVDLLASKTITGSGSGEPFGLLTKLDATTTSEIRCTTAGTFDAAQIFRVWNALPERWRARASWVMSVSTESQVRSFGATPNPSSYFTVDLTAEGVSQLNGRPNLVTDYMPAYSGTTGTANIAIVGDLSAAMTVVQRAGLQVERIPMLFQQQTAGSGVAVPVGSRGFFAWGRLGADVILPGAARLLNQT
jgi:HK97 family phage major capsid protein